MECSLAFYAAVRGGTGDSRDDRSCWVAWNHMTLSPMLFVLSASPIVARAGEFGGSKGCFRFPLARFVVVRVHKATEIICDGVDQGPLDEQPHLTPIWWQSPFSRVWCENDRRRFRHQELAASSRLS